MNITNIVEEDETFEYTEYDDVIAVVFDYLPIIDKSRLEGVERAYNGF